MNFWHALAQAGPAAVGSYREQDAWQRKQQQLDAAQQGDSIFANAMRSSFAPPPMTQPPMPPQGPMQSPQRPGFTPMGNDPTRAQGQMSMPRPQGPMNAPPQGMPQGDGQARGELDWRQVYTAIARDNPGAHPGAVVAAMEKALPFMNQQSRAEYQELRTQIATMNANRQQQQGDRRLDQADRGLDLRQQGLDNTADYRAQRIAQIDQALAAAGAKNPQLKARIDQVRTVYDNAATKTRTAMSNLSYAQNNPTTPPAAIAEAQQRFGQAQYAEMLALHEYEKLAQDAGAPPAQTPSTAPAAAAQPAPSTAQPAAPPAQAQPNPKQIELLKSNPNMAPDFDKKFGPGAAKKWLGKGGPLGFEYGKDPNQPYDVNEKNKGKATSTFMSGERVAGNLKPQGFESPAAQIRDRDAAGMRQLKPGEEAWPRAPEQPQEAGMIPRKRALVTTVPPDDLQIDNTAPRMMSTPSRGSAESAPRRSKAQLKDVPLKDFRRGELSQFSDDRWGTEQGGRELVASAQKRLDEAKKRRSEIGKEFETLQKKYKGMRVDPNAKPDLDLRTAFGTASVEFGKEDFDALTRNLDEEIQMWDATVKRLSKKNKR